MKGHLGFRCRACRKPGPPTNLRQVGTGLVSDQLSAMFAWDAPEDIGSGPVLEYLVEKAENYGSSGYYWEQIGGTSPMSVSFCEQPVAVRVSARNRCGYGQPAVLTSFQFLGGTTVALLTGSGSILPPCWSYSATFYCLGCGGTGIGGGGGGAATWKTWTRSSGQPWGVVSYTVLNASNNTGPARSEVTYNGQTVSAGGGDATGPGFVISLGDSGRNGGSGGYSVESASFSQVGVNFYGRWYYGGSLGGGAIYGTNNGAQNAEAAAVNYCKRVPAPPAMSYVLGLAAIRGFRVTEECEVEPAFGSGGVRIPVAGYYGDAYFNAGYGGGGFPSAPGGPGCILAQYS